MNNIKELSENLKSRINKYADEKRKRWFENYIKHNTKYRGVTTPQITTTLKSWYIDQSLKMTKVLGHE